MAEGSHRFAPAFFELLHKGLAKVAPALGVDIPPLEDCITLGDLWEPLTELLAAADKDRTRAATKAKPVGALLDELLEYAPPKKAKQKPAPKDAKMTEQQVLGGLMALQAVSRASIKDMAKALGCPPATASLKAMAAIVAAKPKPDDVIGAAGVKLVKRTPAEAPKPKADEEDKHEGAKGDANARAATKGPAKVR